MTWKIKKSTLLRTAAISHIRIGSSWRDIARASIWKTDEEDGTTGWRNFITPTPTPTPPPPTPTPTPTPPPPPPPVVLTVSIPSPVQVHKAVLSGTSSTVVSSNITATVTNGTPPFIYAWSRVSWDAATPPNVAPANTATVVFSQNMPVDTTRIGRFKCAVTDSLGNKGEGYVDLTWTLTLKDWDIGDKR